MVYIDRGRVYNRQPWSARRVYEMFWGFLMVVWMFLQSMVEPLTGGNRSRDTRGGGGGSGGGGGGGGGRGGPRPPKRIGRVMTMSDCTVPGGG